jgi:transcriptional regulator with XRE-family HTH domain
MNFGRDLTRPGTSINITVMATRPVEIDATGKQTAANIERLRSTLGISQRQLAARLTELGRPIPGTALSKIERGERRVDVDDLAAFAIALGVGPATLLLPPVADDTEVKVTGAGTVTAKAAWDWADGISPLLPPPGEGEDEGALAHAMRSRPEGRRADRLADTVSPQPLGRLTKTELIQLLDNLKDALSAE